MSNRLPTAFFTTNICSNRSKPHPENKKYVHLKFRGIQTTCRTARRFVISSSVVEVRCCMAFNLQVQIVESESCTKYEIKILWETTTCHLHHGNSQTFILRSTANHVSFSNLVNNMLKFPTNLGAMQQMKIANHATLTKLRQKLLSVDCRIQKVQHDYSRKWVRIPKPNQT